jgi:hypothetical protein
MFTAPPIPIPVPIAKNTAAIGHARLIAANPASPTALPTNKPSMLTYIPVKKKDIVDGITNFRKLFNINITSKVFHNV